MIDLPHRIRLEQHRIRPSQRVGIDREFVGWLASLHGVLRLDALGPLDRHLFRSGPLARSLTADLLVGWGADRDDVDVAGSHLDRLAALGPLAPPPGASQ